MRYNSIYIVRSLKQQTRSDRDGCEAAKVSVYMRTDKCEMSGELYEIVSRKEHRKENKKKIHFAL